MNKKIFLSLFLLIAIPLTGLAQQGDVDPQGDSSCVSIINNLRYRATDTNTSGEVSVLQDFLQAGGYLKSNPVGFFGLMTTSAVKKFQAEKGISATGYVGPITRQKIKDQTCSTSDYPVSTQVPIVLPVTSSTVSVLSPNGGEKLIAGSGIAINWSSSNVQPNDGLSIYYISEEGYQKSIKDSQKTIPASAVYIGKSISSYYWQIPSGLSGAYRILVAYVPSGYGDMKVISYGDYSDSYFKIAPKSTADGSVTPSITVYSPNGGEVIKQGSVVRIKWNAPAVSSVYIKLRKGNDTYHNPDPTYNSYEASIALMVKADQGYFDWTVPNSLPDGTDYSVRVIDSNATISDDSNGYFTISSGNSGSTGTSIQDFGLLSVKSDKSVVNSGDKVTLGFTVDNNVEMYSKMMMYCPVGITSSFGTSGKDLCNVWYDFPMTPSAAEIIFKNASSTSQTVVPNFYEYKLSDPNYAHGKTTSIVVNPAI